MTEKCQKINLLLDNFREVNVSANNEIKDWNETETANKLAKSFQSLEKYLNKLQNVICSDND